MLPIQLPPYPADLRSLTSLRFFAALVILIYHYDITVNGGMIFYNLNGAVNGRGYLAVDLFFVLSGFILTRVLPRRRAILIPPPDARRHVKHGMMTINAARGA